MFSIHTGSVAPESPQKMKTASERDEKKMRCAEFVTFASSSILHLHVTGRPTESTSSLRDCYYMVAQTEVQGCIVLYCVEFCAQNMSRFSQKTWGEIRK